MPDEKNMYDPDKAGIGQDIPGQSFEHIPKDRSTGIPAGTAGGSQGRVHPGFHIRKDCFEDRFFAGIVPVDRTFSDSDCSCYFPDGRPVITAFSEQVDSSVEYLFPGGFFSRNLCRPASLSR